MTHEQLIERAVRWLKGHGCYFVLSGGEAYCSVGECADAIGWEFRGSILIECKTTRADYFADRRKPWRRACGLGMWRYYLAPAGVIPPAKLPACWGLLECHPKQIRRRLRAKRVPIGWWAAGAELRLLAKRAAKLQEALQHATDRRSVDT